MIIKKTFLLLHLITIQIVLDISAQNDDSFLGPNTSRTGISISTMVSDLVASDKHVLPTLPQTSINSALKDSVAVARSAFQTYSIARPPLVPTLLGITSVQDHSTKSVPLSNREPESEIMSSLSFDPTTSAAPEANPEGSMDQSISTTKATLQYSAQPLQSTENPELIPTEVKFPSRKTSGPESISVAVISTTAIPLQQSNVLEDDTEQISEEDYISDADSAKPDAVDNEAIEELVNRFLNSDTLENGKEKMLNKDALKLINSSKYWDIDNLEPEGSVRDNMKAQEWMDGYAVEAQKVLHEVALAGWSYVTSVSHLTKQLLDEAEEILAKFVKASSKQAKQFDLFSIENSSLKRQFELLLVEGISALDENDFSEYIEAQKLLSKTYAETSICEIGSTTICPYRASDVASIIAHENDAAKALHFWTAWRDTLGPKLVISYERLMHLINKAAKLNGFTDGGAMWRSPYDFSHSTNRKKSGHNDTVALLQHLYQKINPFYRQLHAYIRRQIAALYGLTNVAALTQDGPIPAHLLKSIAGDNWIAFYPETKPFQEEDSIATEVQENLLKQNYTVKNMFKQVYKMFKRLGFGKLPARFWSNSVFTRTWSKDMLCEPPAAYDMRGESDYRVKACAQLNLPDFELAHKLLVQIYYYYLLRDQPLLFREPTNPSFLIALTNAFATNARNLDYLKMMKLVGLETDASRSRTINRLYMEALEEFIKLPFDIAIDMWRFHVFDGTSTKLNWNTDWCQLSEFFQGIKPPIERKATDFDIIASSTVAQMHAPAMKHFFAYIMKFQILKALCGNRTYLSDGCMVQSGSVINNIKKVMLLGSSINWREALQIITGSEELDASAMLEYYQPLINWLEEVNTKDHAFIGWDGPGRPFTESDLPKLRERNVTISNSLTGILTGNQFAFPGSDCSNGRECLLDSVCRNGICECKDGLYTLRIGETYNCVPDNPADAGFADGHGGLIIGLHPADKIQAASPDPEDGIKPLAEPEAAEKKDLPASSESLPELKGATGREPLLSILLLPIALFAHL